MITAPAPTMNQPGRGCPLSYRYAPSVFRRAPELRTDAMYVVGGLYGNPFALECIRDMARAERARVDLVFNGDFNWFNIDLGSFAKINETVLSHTAIRGNVETELVHDEEANGCGCAYPEWIRDDVVTWSNQIMQRLRVTALGFTHIRDRLAALPMHLVAEVGGVRIAVVHGDAESLAGWSFAYEALSEKANDAGLRQTLREANVTLFASTHTCLPAVKLLALNDGTGAVVNNGAAGMPNLKGSTFGLITRIAIQPTRYPSAFSLRLRGLYIDLLMVNYDQGRWLELFQHNWPSGSSASLSYLNRINVGPELAGPISV